MVEIRPQVQAALEQLEVLQSPNLCMEGEIRTQAAAQLQLDCQPRKSPWMEAGILPRIRLGSEIFERCSCGFWATIEENGSRRAA